MENCISHACKTAHCPLDYIYILMGTGLANFKQWQSSWNKSQKYYVQLFQFILEPSSWAYIHAKCILSCYNQMNE